MLCSRTCTNSSLMITIKIAKVVESCHMVRMCVKIVISCKINKQNLFLICFSYPLNFEKYKVYLFRNVHTSWHECVYSYVACLDNWFVCMCVSDRSLFKHVVRQRYSCSHQVSLKNPSSLKAMGYRFIVNVS